MFQSLYPVVLLIIVLSYLSGSCGIVFQDNRLYEGSSCILPDARPGVCALNCSADISPDQRKICSFKGSHALICCPSNNSYPLLEKVCRDRSNYIGEVQSSRYKRQFNPQEDDDKIQVQPIHHVVTNEHPHMAALGIRRSELVIEWYCGGTVIHELFVLTAAHCLTNIGSPDVVRVGDTDLRPNPNVRIYAPPKTQFYAISNHIHEGYRPPLYYNDIALVRILRQTRRGAKPPLPACIWMGEELPTANLLMMGYGAPAFSQEHTNKLYQGNLTMVKREECSLSYDGFTDLPKGITDSQICAHDPNGVLDTCEGDSGGPLQFNADDQTRTPYLVGITSFGVLCLDGNPGVYTKVGAYLDWIEGTIRNLMRRDAFLE